MKNNIWTKDTHLFVSTEMKTATNKNVNKQTLQLNQIG